MIYLSHIYWDLKLDKPLKFPIKTLNTMKNIESKFQRLRHHE